MATYIKNGKKWRAQVRKMGKSKSASFDTKSESVRWAMALEAAIEAGEHNGIAKITFGELLDKYIKEVTLTKRSAREERLRLLRVARGFLGEIQLAELSKNDFKQWQAQRLREVSVASVLRERNSLSAVLNQAIMWDYLKENPLKLVEKPKAPPPRDRRYSDDEIERLVYVSGYDFNHNPFTRQSRVGAALLFAIETAMRAGEICGLQWQHINFEKRTAFLPKTKNGHPRTVPLSSKAVQILRHLEFFNGESEQVFGLNPANLDANFRKIKEKAGLANANLHFHDTRREALTRLAKKLSVMELAKLSGHRDLSILQNTYYNPDMAEIAQKLA